MRDSSPLPAAVAVARLTTDAASARRISDLLTESFDPDAVAIAAWEEPGGRWPITLYFRDAPDESAVRDLVALASTPDLARALTFDTLAPTDWVRKSLKGLKPVAAGRFVVHGSHDRAYVAQNRIGIEIEAGLAFGTGHHGTTRGCLLALDSIIKGGVPAHGGVLDVGTGTGVLAIAAAKSLRRPVLASDIDRRAVRTARENAQLNRARSRSIEVIGAAGLAGRRFRERGPFAVVLANILLAPLKQLARPMTKLTVPGGSVVLSGLLRAQELPALGAFLPHGFALPQRVPLEGWITLVLVRRTRRRPRRKQA